MTIRAQNILALAAFALTGAAFAQTAPAAPEPDYTLSFNASVASEYRYRGISQSRFKPALQGGADFAHKSGVYVGTWASTIKWIKDAGGDANVELDLYGGYKGTVGDVGYDVGVLRYQYSGHKLAVSPNTTEVYGAVTYNVFTAKYSHSTTNLFGFSNSKNSGYLDLSATFDLGDGWSVVPHLGHQRVKNNGDFSYTDYSLSLNKDLGNGLVLTGTVLGTDAKKIAGVPVYIAPNGKNLGRDGVVLSVKYNF